MKEDGASRRWKTRAIGLTIALIVGVLGASGEATAWTHKDRESGRAPVLEIQQDGPMLEVVVPARSNRGVQNLAFRLKSVDTDALVEGETEPPQIKLVLAIDETYEFSARAQRSDGRWGPWSDPVRVTGGDTEAYPWAVQANAVDGGVSLRWADTNADEYHYEVRTRRGRLAASGRTTGTDVIVDGLRNGRTYRVTIQARYGDRLTPASPAIPVTPNEGAVVSVENRDFFTEPLTGRTRLTVPTAVTGATERIERLNVRVIPDGLDGRTRRTVFDREATATTGVEGAWTSRPTRIEPLDYELIAVVKGQVTNRAGEPKTGVLSSSLQTWLLGNVDAFAPGASEFTRIGTFR